MTYQQTIEEILKTWHQKTRPKNEVGFYVRKDLDDAVAAIVTATKGIVPEPITPENIQLLPPSNSAGYTIYSDGHNECRTAMLQAIEAKS